MKTFALFALLLSLGLAELRAQSFVPKMGSPVRTEICDAVRRHTRNAGAKFIIHYMRVQDDWALFDGSPTVEDKSTGFDAVAAVLRRQEGKWRVVGSWAHGDVPDPSDYKQQAKDVPDSLLRAYVEDQRAKQR